jgi:hypothetical protein
MFEEIIMKRLSMMVDILDQRTRSICKMCPASKHLSADNKPHQDLCRECEDEMVRPFLSDDRISYYAVFPCPCVEFGHERAERLLRHVVMEWRKECNRHGR